MRTSLFLAPLLLASLAATGCSKKETVASSDIATHGMALDVIAKGNGSNTYVFVAVHVGDWNSNSFASLDKGDTLVVHVPGGADRPLQINSSNGKTWYETTVDGVTAGEFAVDLVRTSAASAKGNRIALPPAFNLTAPPTGTVSRKNPLTVTWDSPGSGYDLSVSLDGDCISHVEKSVVGDPSSFTFNAGDVQPIGGASGTHAKDVCPVTLTVTRRIFAQESGGNFSSELGHQSQRDAQQLRVATFQSGE
ncbi:MAG: hypothetical protein NVSMB47_06410 [Polyangiales bacterium]